MTRTEFVKRYAARSGLSDEWAVLGFAEVAGQVRVAMPCACGHEDCEGWAMLPPDGISHHLTFDAPDELRAAYRNCIGDLIA